jgi:hypothetical protein
MREFEESAAGTIKDRKTIISGAVLPVYTWYY